jgi:hypothetical protein
MLGALKLRTSSLSFTVGGLGVRVTRPCLACNAIAKGGITSARGGELTLHLIAHYESIKVLYLRVMATGQLNVPKTLGSFCNVRMRNVFMMVDLECN